MGGFLPKVMEKQFYLPAGRAAFLYGVIAVTCALFGNLTGEQKKLQYFKIIYVEKEQE